MFRFLIDTCVWLDIVKDPELQPLLDIMDELVQMQEMSLILPRTVIVEFQRNKQRVVTESCRSLSGVFKRVKDTVNKFGEPKNKKAILQYLSDLDYRIPLLGQSAVESIDKIEHLNERVDNHRVN